VARSATPTAPPSASTTRPVRHVREHERRVAACTACGLSSGRTKAVPGEGPMDARLVLIGVAPRRQEDLKGVAFAGGARNVLDNALMEAEIDPAQVRITSLVRCRPPNDRLPSRDEVTSCAPNLVTELGLMHPEVIVSFGAFVTEVLSGRRVEIERIAGYRMALPNGVTLIPTYHPVDAVRGVPQAASSLRRDLAAAKAVLDGRLRTGPEVLNELRSSPTVRS
jgi:uracil-DNA glycosylase